MSSDGYRSADGGTWTFRDDAELSISTQEDRMLISMNKPRDYDFAEMSLEWMTARDVANEILRLVDTIERRVQEA